MDKKREKMFTDLDGRNKIIFLHRLYDHLCRKREGTDNKILGTSKQL